jgi:hypothetical protein
MFIYPIYYQNWRNISTIYTHNKTSIKQNILTIKKIHREAGRAKDLSAPRYCYYRYCCYYFCGPGQRSRYSDSLPAGQDGDRITAWVGKIFRTRPDRPSGPCSLLYKAYQVSFPGVKRSGRGVDHPLYLVPRLKEQQSYTSTPPLGLRSRLLE